MDNATVDTTETTTEVVAQTETIVEPKAKKPSGPAEVGEGLTLQQLAAYIGVSKTEMQGALAVLCKAGLAKETGKRYKMGDNARRVAGKPASLYTVDDSFLNLFSGE